MTATAAFVSPTTDFPSAILVVDDVASIGSLVAATLAVLPYRLLLANSVRSAIAVLNEFDRVRALVVDVQLPDGNGMEIIEHARRRHPGLPALLMSGSGIGNLKIDFIAKPFEPDELLSRVMAMTKTVEC